MNRGLPIASPVSTWESWNDEDFYKLKIALDKIYGLGFVYYLLNPREAIRDFRLWLKFRHTIKPPAPKPRPDLSRFKQRKDRKDANKKVSVPISDRLQDILKKQPKEFGDRIMTMMNPLYPRAHGVALLMQQNNMIPNTKEALDTQVNEVLKFDDAALTAFELTIKNKVWKKE